MTHVAILGGAGTVGATTAYTLAGQEPGWEITLVDPDHDTARGHGLDVDSLYGHASHAVGRQLTPGPERTRADAVTAVPDAAALGGAGGQPDVVVVAASAPRPPDSAARGGREAFLERNADVMADVGRGLGDAGIDPVPVLVVTNPLDRMTYLLWRATGAAWDRRRFVGYSLSETARLARALAVRYGVSPGRIECPIVGEHGEEIVPLFSRTRVGGEPVDLNESERAALRDEVRDMPYDVIGLRGAAETSRWVTGYGVALLARSLARGGPPAPVCLSTPLAGEYGFDDVAMSVPVRLSDDGVERVLDWELAPAERDRLTAAYESIRDDLAGV
ncbi:MAG: malate dehydrogenase [Haloferacaceae archaeon]